jgi:7-cyano-7-deazaguanine synthase
MSETAAPSLVLLSGGMDSVTALYHARAAGPVRAALSFDYGAKHHARELPLAQWHADRLGVEHHVVSLDFVAKHFTSDLLATGGEIPKGHYEEATMKQTVVPFRNGIMLAIAGGFAESCGAAAVVIAAHAGDHAIYPDCRETFMQSMASALRLGTYVGVELRRPFIDLSKAEIARRGAELGVDFAKTWSCYVGAERHCGECGTCVERREAFLVAGLSDPTEYEKTPPLPARPA